MRGHSILVAALVAALIIAAACSSFDGATTGGPDDGLDAAPDAPTADGAADATDAAVTADADTRRWCERQTKLLFCDDFDDGPLGATWDVELVTGGTLRFDALNSTSTPRALGATIAPEPSLTVVPQAAFQKTFPLHPRKMRYAVDVRINTRDDAGAPAQVVYFGIDGPSIYYKLGFLVRKDDTAFDEDTNADGGVPTPVRPIASQLALGRWTRITIDVVLMPDAGSPSATVNIDGTDVLSTPIVPPIRDGTLGITAGVWFVNPPTSGWDISFDNVALSAE
jgi:hypothetical protein